MNDKNKFDDYINRYQGQHTPTTIHFTSNVIKGIITYDKIDGKWVSNELDIVFPGHMNAPSIKADLKTKYGGKWEYEEWDY